jgi:hypothetical protein
VTNVQPFFFGFAIATLVGWLSSFVVASWFVVEKTRKRMFVNIPRPSPRLIPDSRNVSIGTEPEQSPIQVLLQGCMTIIAQLFILAAFLLAVGIILIFGLKQELTEEFLAGVLFAAVLGFLLQHIRKNWKQISQLYKMITNPPLPALRSEPTSPPNNYYVTAILAPPPLAPPAYPLLPPFAVLIRGIFGISWRLILQLVLLLLLYRSLLAMYFYLRNEPLLSGVLGI